MKACKKLRIFLGGMLIYYKLHIEKIMYNKGTADKKLILYSYSIMKIKGEMEHDGAEKWRNEYGNTRFIRIDSPKSLASKINQIIPFNFIYDIVVS